MSQHLRTSGPSARSMCPIHVLASTKMDPLQDPCLRIHVSASLYLTILCKIHVSGFMSQHLCISRSSARSMSPIHVSASTNMDPLQDPCLRIHVSACLSIFASQDPLQDPCLRIHVSASSYLRILCKIHVSDSCLSVHQKWILYKIHIFGFMFQHLCNDISGETSNNVVNECAEAHWRQSHGMVNLHLWLVVTRALTRLTNGSKATSQWHLPNPSNQSQSETGPTGDWNLSEPHWKILFPATAYRPIWSGQYNIQLTTYHPSLYRSS